MKKCLICEKELESDKWGTTYGATIWRSEGNYGSSVYDPIGDSSQYLEAYVCDVCLVGKKHLLEEVHFQRKFEVLERKEPDFGADYPEFKERPELTGSKDGVEE